MDNSYSLSNQWTREEAEKTLRWMTFSTISGWRMQTFTETEMVLVAKSQEKEVNENSAGV